MNDSRYGVIRNIQDDIYGGRHAYVELHTPKFADFCASLGASHLLLKDPAQAGEVLAKANALAGPVIVEVDMASWGPFKAKFAGPILKKD
jgi:acetolactate synthase-1/2/3 large subunit